MKLKMFLIFGFVYACLCPVAFSQSSLGQASVVQNRGLNVISVSSNKTVLVGGYNTDFPENRVVGYGLLWKLNASHPSAKKLSFLGKIDQMLWLTDQSGWISSIGHGVYQTIDRGENWKRLDSSNDIKGSYFFLNAELGWYFAKNEHLKRLENENISDLAKFDNFPYVKKLQFTDRDNGWLYDVVDATPRFQRSRNGGQTWEIKSVDNTDFYAFQFVNDSHGFALTNKALYKTADGGESWKLLRINVRESWHGKLFFLDENRGWILGSDICQTNDGGTSWSCYGFDREVKRKIPTDFVFIDESRGWLLTEDGLYQTKNGGKKWKRQILRFGELSF